jgi:hypothetical protein
LAVRRVKLDREYVTDVAMNSIQQTDVMGANCTLVESVSSVPIMQLGGVADAIR